MTSGGQDTRRLSLHLKVPFASVMSFIFLLKLVRGSWSPPHTGERAFQQLIWRNRPAVQKAISYQGLDPSSRPGSFCGCLWLPGSFCPIPQVPKLLSRAGVHPARGLLFCPACEGPSCSGSSPEALPHCHAGVGSLRQESALGVLENKKSCFPGVFFDGKPELCGLAAPCPLRNIRQPLPASWRGRPVSTLCRGCRWGLQAACPGRGQDGAAACGAVTNPPKPSSITQFIHCSSAD